VKRPVKQGETQCLSQLQKIENNSGGFHVSILCAQISNNMTYVANLTTGDYIICQNLEDQNNKLRYLTRPLNETNALMQSDIGQSIWKRDDHIVIVPPHLNQYVHDNFAQLLNEVEEKERKNEKKENDYISDDDIIEFD
jgi:hypothetical protein